MGSRTARMIAAVGNLSASLVLGLTLLASEAAEFATIPTIINILMNSGISEEEARKAVEGANAIFNKNKANLKLTVLKVRNNVKDGDDGDGDLTPVEFFKVEKAGREEINKLSNQKGKKIVFVKSLPPATNGKEVVGVSDHRKGVVFVKAGLSREERARTLTHEVLHNLTLAEKHRVIEGANGESDDDGHTPQFRSNIMFPSVRGSGTKITELQLKKIRDDQYLKDFEAKEVDKNKKESGERKHQQFGANTDPVGDQTGGAIPHFDLDQVQVASETERSSISLLLTLGGLFPRSGMVDATYSLLFDADAELGTGILSHGFAGIDREVTLHVTGDASVASLDVTGIVLDHIGSLQSPLPQAPNLLVSKRIFDFAGEAEPVADQILVNLPKPLLGLSALQVPLGIAAEDVGGVRDSMSLFFDQARFASDAELRIPDGEVFPGDLVPFMIQRLMPDSPFTLFIGDQPLLEGVLDHDGAFSGSFVFPSGLEGLDFFVTAQDASGEFAFNIVSVHSAPTLLLLCSGAVVAGRIAMGQRQRHHPSNRHRAKPGKSSDAREGARTQTCRRGLPRPMGKGANGTPCLERAAGGPERPRGTPIGRAH